jgi:hypothetical protein
MNDKVKLYINLRYQDILYKFAIDCHIYINVSILFFRNKLFLKKLQIIFGICYYYYSYASSNINL